MNLLLSKALQKSFQSFVNTVNGPLIFRFVDF